MTKTFTGKTLTSGNACYSYAGAQFGVYKDTPNSAVITTLTTNAAGVTEAKKVGKPGIYYVKEIKAPPGYELDPAPKGPFTLTTANASVGTAYKGPFEVTVPNRALFDPVEIQIEKKNRTAESSEKINTPAGTKFTINFYKDGYYTAADLPAAPTRSWTFAAKEKNGKFYAGYKDEYLDPKTANPPLYKDDNGKPAMPLGTFTITEKEAAKGYINDGTFGKGVKTYIAQVVANADSTAAVLRPVRGSSRVITNTNIQFDVGDTPKVPEISTTARDKDSNIRVSMAEGDVTIEDTVAYTDLTVGQKYTMKGRLVHTSTVKAGQTSQSLSLGSLPAGIYAVQLDGPSSVKGSTLIRK